MEVSASEVDTMSQKATMSQGRNPTTTTSIRAETDSQQMKVSDAATTTTATPSLNSTPPGTIAQMQGATEGLLVIKGATGGIQNQSAVIPPIPKQVTVQEISSRGTSPLQQAKPILVPPVTISLAPTDGPTSQEQQTAKSVKVVGTQLITTTGHIVKEKKGRFNVLQDAPFLSVTTDANGGPSQNPRVTFRQESTPTDAASTPKINHLAPNHGKEKLDAPQTNLPTPTTALTNTTTSVQPPVAKKKGRFMVTPADAGDANSIARERRQASVPQMTPGSNDSITISSNVPLHQQQQSTSTAPSIQYTGHPTSPQGQATLRSQPSNLGPFPAHASEAVQRVSHATATVDASSIPPPAPPPQNTQQIAKDTHAAINKQPTMAVQQIKPQPTASNIPFQQLNHQVAPPQTNTNASISNQTLTSSSLDSAVDMQGNSDSTEQKPQHTLKVPKPQAPPRTVGKPPASFDSKGVGSSIGLGKLFYFLDQMKAEVTEADRSIKTLHTESRCLKDKNKELEAKCQKLEKKWKEEKCAREAADTKNKSLQKKIRELKEQLASLHSAAGMDGDEKKMDSAVVGSDTNSRPNSLESQRESRSVTSSSTRDQSSFSSSSSSVNNSTQFPTGSNSSVPNIQQEGCLGPAPVIRSNATLANQGGLRGKSPPPRPRDSFDDAILTHHLNGAQANGIGSIPIQQGTSMNNLRQRSTSGTDSFDPLKQSLSDMSLTSKFSQSSLNPSDHSRSQGMPTLGMHQNGMSMNDTQSVLSIGNQNVPFMHNHIVQSAAPGAMLIPQNGIMSGMMMNGAQQTMQHQNNAQVSGGQALAQNNSQPMNMQTAMNGQLMNGQVHQSMLNGTHQAQHQQMNGNGQQIQWNQAPQFQQPNMGQTMQNAALGQQQILNGGTMSQPLISQQQQQHNQHQGSQTNPIAQQNGLSMQNPSNGMNMMGQQFQQPQFTMNGGPHVNAFAPHRVL